MSKEKSKQPSNPSPSDGKVQIREGAVKGNTLPTYQAPPPPPPKKSK